MCFPWLWDPVVRSLGTTQFGKRNALKVLQGRKSVHSQCRKKSFGNLFWSRIKHFQPSSGYKNPLKRETNSTTEIFPLWPPFLLAKKVPHWNRVVYGFFSQLSAQLAITTEAMRETNPPSHSQSSSRTWREATRRGFISDPQTLGAFFGTLGWSKRASLPPATCRRKGVNFMMNFNWEVIFCSIHFPQKMALKHSHEISPQNSPFLCVNTSNCKKGLSSYFPTLRTRNEKV